MPTHSEVAYASPGTGDHGVRGEHHCPEQGASGQSLRLLTGFSDSSFQRSSRSSCLAPSGGKQRWLIKATWPQFVPRMKPALSSGTLPDGLLRSPRSLTPEPRKPDPRDGESHRKRAGDAKPRAGAAGAPGALGTNTPGCGPRPPPRALAINPKADFYQVPLPTGFPQS